MTTATDLPGRFKGINGTARTDRLLSLEEEHIAHRVEAAKAARKLVVSSGALPGISHERVLNPEPGDWVVNTDKRHMSEDDWIKGCGVLIEHRGEADGDDWWYVQYGPGERDICRWGNAAFCAVPMT